MGQDGAGVLAARSGRYLLASPLIILLASLPILLLAAYAPLNHDEHQFVAPGALLARQGLLPYRDYPCFHMPNQLLAFALLFKVTDHLLLAARAFSALCGAGILAVLFGWTFRIFRGQPDRVRYLLATAAVLLFVTSPFFIVTAGLSWNHASSTLLLLLSFACGCKALRHLRGVRDRSLRTAHRVSRSASRSGEPEDTGQRRSEPTLDADSRDRGLVIG
jgi:MFS family permease